LYVRVSLVKSRPIAVRNRLDHTSYSRSPSPVVSVVLSPGPNSPSRIIARSPNKAIASERLLLDHSRQLDTNPAFRPQVVLGFCPCGPLGLNISPKKTEKNQINVNCVSHTVVENLKQFAFKGDKSRGGP
jgi:hypothetical protein